MVDSGRIADCGRVAPIPAPLRPKAMEEEKIFSYCSGFPLLIFLKDLLWKLSF